MIDYHTFCQIRHLRDTAKLTIAQIGPATRPAPANRRALGKTSALRTPRHGGRDPPGEQA